MSTRCPEGSLDNRFVCPVCRATQEWSDVCRRCRCDLRLLRQADLARRRARQQVLLHLRAGCWAEAQRAAQTCHALQPDADSRRLLAVCCLLGGKFRQAAGWTSGSVQSVGWDKIA
jgi:hypothetical protein